MRTQIFPSFRPPDWVPLERALAAEFGAGAVEATAAFWFIGFADGPADVGELRLYKHSGTRRQIALDSEGLAYRWFSEIRGYSRVVSGEALVSLWLGNADG
jgi:hypothetical protein